MGDLENIDKTKSIIHHRSAGVATVNVLIWIPPGFFFGPYVYFLNKREVTVVFIGSFYTQWQTAFTHYAFSR